MIRNLDLYKSLKNLFFIFKSIYSGNLANLDKTNSQFVKLEKIQSFLAAELQEKYSNLILGSDATLPLDKFERIVFSQCGEEGVILEILSRLPNHSGTFVNLGAGGHTSNIYLLNKYFGFKGLSIDGDLEALQNINHRKLYRSPFDEVQNRFLCEWITKENINQILLNNYLSEDLDVLVIDIDGMDYWIWDAITDFEPKLVVIEYNSSFGSEMSVTVPYMEKFNRWDSQWHNKGWYHGASLKALTNLANKKGYTLIHCDRMGVNAYFVSNEYVEMFMPIAVSKAFRSNLLRESIATQEEQYKMVKSFPLAEV